jgi:hypothetical protein
MHNGHHYAASERGIDTLPKHSSAETSRSGLFLGNCTAADMMLHRLLGGMARAPRVRA